MMLKPNQDIKSLAEKMRLELHDKRLEDDIPEEDDYEEEEFYEEEPRSKKGRRASRFSDEKIMTAGDAMNMYSEMKRDIQNDLKTQLSDFTASMQKYLEAEKEEKNELFRENGKKEGMDATTMMAMLINQGKNSNDDKIVNAVKEIGDANRQAMALMIEQVRSSKGSSAPELITAISPLLIPLLEKMLEKGDDTSNKMMLTMFETMMKGAMTPKDPMKDMSSMLGLVKEMKELTPAPPALTTDEDGNIVSIAQGESKSSILGSLTSPEVLGKVIGLFQLMASQAKNETIPNTEVNNMKRQFNSLIGVLRKKDAIDAKRYKQLSDMSKNNVASAMRNMLNDPNFAEAFKASPISKEDVMRDVDSVDSKIPTDNIMGIENFHEETPPISEEDFGADDDDDFIIINTDEEEQANEQPSKEGEKTNG